MKSLIPKLTPWKLDLDANFNSTLNSYGGTELTATDWKDKVISLANAEISPLPLSPPLIQKILDNRHRPAVEDTDFFWINKRPIKESLFIESKVIIIVCADWLDVTPSTDASALLTRVKPTFLALESQLKEKRISLLFLSPNMATDFCLGRSFLPTDEIELIDITFDTTLPVYYYGFDQPTTPHFWVRKPPTTFDVTVGYSSFMPKVNKEKWVPGNGELLHIGINQTWYVGQQGCTSAPFIPGQTFRSGPEGFPITYQFVLAGITPDGNDPGTGFVVTGYTTSSAIALDYKSRCLENITNTFGLDMFSRSQLCYASLTRTPSFSGTLGSQLNTIAENYSNMALEVVDELVGSVTGNHTNFSGWLDDGSDTPNVLDQVVTWIKDFYNLS